MDKETKRDIKIMIFQFLGAFALCLFFLDGMLGWVIVDFQAPIGVYNWIGNIFCVGVTLGILYIGLVLIKRRENQDGS